MSLGMNRYTKLLKIYLEFGTNFYSTVPKLKDKSGQLLISCKRKKFDHYSSMYYSKLDEVPLVSKGWNHSKAKGDFFTVHPLSDNIPEEKYSFPECGLNNDLISTLQKQDIINATEFQYRAITTIDSGKCVK